MEFVLAQELKKLRDDMELKDSRVSISSLLHAENVLKF